ncbi:MAG: protein phosphatase 2C domain-containing protein [Hormoscilla sp. SP12CHS1]|nr:protein phosphatase 2C domain-containing protein [Hormoscilla sp. SP12CHS1]
MINIEIASGKGEDAYFADSDYHQTVVIGVFDGLGGRSAGYDGETGGRIASREAAKLSKDILWNQKGILTKDIADRLQQRICTDLKTQADRKMGISKIRGSLASKRLCTTIAMASMPKQKEPNQEFEVNLAWMGDSRIYFLSPTKGLQQLTKDDLESSKDAFQTRKSTITRIAKLSYNLTLRPGASHICLAARTLKGPATRTKPQLPG